MARSILRAGKIAGVVIVAIIVVAAVLYSVGVLSVAQADDLEGTRTLNLRIDSLIEVECKSCNSKDLWAQLFTA